MADYRISIADRTYLVSIHDDELEVNGDRVDYNIDSLDGNGLHILRQPNRSVEAYVEAKASGTYDIQIEGNHLNAQVSLGSQIAAPHPGRNSGRVTAPMPGLIIDILVHIGEEVKKGQTLIIQEAMKMQMKLRSPQDGIVAEIAAQAGQQVEKGVLLISLQSAG